jgi:hypothetical protein
MPIYVKMSVECADKAGNSSLESIWMVFASQEHLDLEEDSYFDMLVDPLSEWLNLHQRDMYVDGGFEIEIIRKETPTDPQELLFEVPVRTWSKP